MNQLFFNFDALGNDRSIPAVLMRPRAVRPAPPVYEFARKSAVPCAGVDLADSARHRANEWRGLAAAEEDGSAARAVTRAALLKNEPPDWPEITDENAAAVLAVYLMIQKFPASPGTSRHVDAWKKRSGETDADLRRAYYDAWRTVRGIVPEAVAAGANPEKATTSPAQGYVAQTYYEICERLAFSHPLRRALWSAYDSRFRGKTAPYRTLDAIRTAGNLRRLQIRMAENRLSGLGTAKSADFRRGGVSQLVREPARQEFRLPTLFFGRFRLLAVVLVHRPLDRRPITAGSVLFSGFPFRLRLRAIKLRRLDL